MPSILPSFLAPQATLAGAIEGEFDSRLVVLSIGVATVAGWTALLLAERVARAETTRARVLWLAAGASAMGIGIWAMHFVGMLALRMPIAVHYDPELTVLSLLPGIVAGGAALWSLSRGSAGALRLGLGGLSMASGIGLMHYTGMAAMVMDAEMRYEPRLFGASIAVACVLSTLALFLARRSADGRGAGRRAVVAGGLALGLAVAATHYTAMAAAHYLPWCGPFVAEPEALPPFRLAVLAAGAAGVLLGFAAVCALVDRRLQGMTDDLRRSEERSRMILETAGDAIVSIDERGIVDTFNAAAASIFGYLPSEVIGRDVGLLMPEQEARRHRGYVERYLQGGEPRLLGRRREVHGRRRDGSRFPCALTLGEVGRAGDPRHRFTAVLRDLTEQRALEAQLLQAQKLESIGRLAAGIAHEINTPAQYVGDNLVFLGSGFEELLPLLDACDALRAAIEAKEDPGLRVPDVASAAGGADLDFLRDEIPRALVAAREGIERVAQIVSAMREFTQPGSAEIQPTDLNRALASTAEVTRNEWKEVADLELHLDPELPFVPCVAGEINQAVLHILVNAAQAIAASEAVRSGGRGRIDVRTRSDGEACVVEITDTGPGIPAPIRSRIFDPFFTTREVGKGTGQGLAVARAIVERHGGTLDAESEEGRGATFRIRLPLSRARGS